MTTTLKLKFIKETELARWYENNRGVRQPREKAQSFILLLPIDHMRRR